MYVLPNRTRWGPSRFNALVTEFRLTPRCCASSSLVNENVRDPEISISRSSVAASR